MHFKLEGIGGNFINWGEPFREFLLIENKGANFFKLGLNLPEPKIFPQSLGCKKTIFQCNYAHQNFLFRIKATNLVNWESLDFVVSRQLSRVTYPMVG